MQNRLKQQRLKAGLKIKEVAQRVGKSYQYIRQIEEGINNPPTWELLGKFAEVYSCSVDSLLGLDEDNRPSSNDSMTEDDAEMLQILRGMSDRGRGRLLAIARTLEAYDQE